MAMKKRRAAAKPAGKPAARKVNAGDVLAGRAPLPADVTALRGLHRFPGSKNLATFAGWCVHSGKLRVLERVAAESPALLHEVGPGGRTTLHAAAAKGPAFAKLLLDAGADPGRVDDDGRLPVDFAIKAGNKTVVRLLAPAGDLDSLVLLDYREFERRVLAGDSPRLPGGALTATLRRARLLTNPREASGETRAVAAAAILELVAVLRAGGALARATDVLDVHYLRSEELAQRYFDSRALSGTERAELTAALEPFEAPKADPQDRDFARWLAQRGLVHRGPRERG